ncbi:MAG TPA: HAD family hydrolase [Armatimonadota bacterium]|jgi:putative hydrolase of the HAD superfamily
MFAAIFFDLDNTLCDDTGASRCAVARACHFLGARFPRLAETPLEAAYLTASTALWTDDPVLLRGPVRAMRRQAWATALHQVGGDPTWTDVAVDCYTQARRETYRRFPETIPLLRALRQRYHVGMITNGPADLQREKLTVMGLIGEVDAITIAGESGYSKPQPEIFHLALRHAGCAPAQALMIGDSWEKDIVPARDLGMTALWISPAPPAAAISVATLPHIRDLAHWLAMHPPAHLKT